MVQRGGHFVQGLWTLSLLERDLAGWVYTLVGGCIRARSRTLVLTWERVTIRPGRAPRVDCLLGRIGREYILRLKATQVALR